MRLAEHDTSFELIETPNMNRARDRSLNDQSHEPLLATEQDASSHEDIYGDDGATETEEERTFSWVTYFIFLLLGVAMLWAWNMFLAAAPYFQHRFKGDEWILNHFQPAEISVATITNLTSMLVLGALQKNASYPKRIATALVGNATLFALLAISTYTKATIPAYFGFMLVVVLLSNLSTALIQNGVFSITAGFGRKEYTQAIMTGQAVAGVLPPLAQIVSVAVVPTLKDENGQQSESSKSAFIYFITATVICGITLFAFLHLLHQKQQEDKLRTIDKQDRDDMLGDQAAADADGARQSVPLTRLFKKLPFMSIAVIICFSVTMVYPVFTSVIVSVNGTDPALFIPLAFLVWNIGDLSGRLLTSIPRVLLTHHPFALFCLAMARLLFIPLYLLCNIKGRGATVNSDFFYLAVIQFLFGMTNGYLGSNCMMGAGDWVAPDEREAAGGYMALCLVVGLTIGSLLSFLLGDV